MITKLTCVVLTTLALLTAPAWGGELQTGVLPLTIDAVTPIRLEADEELRIEGVVEAADPVIVVLRIDDMASWSYASRFNGERILPPGPFRWTIAAKGLHTAEGPTLDHSQLRRFIFFVGGGKGQVTINTFAHVKATRLPGQAKGYSLGAETAEIPAGFERITPTDPRAEGRKIFAVHRPAPDPIVASGLRGIEKLRLPWSGGRANVTIWTEDPGEWELLPHPGERRIRINGEDVLSERLTSEEWTQRRYLRGLDVEHGPADDAWTAFGRLRGDARTVEVEPGPDGIVIELAGSSPQALYLSAVLIEPVASFAALGQVQSLRAEWYRSNWPVLKPRDPAQPTPLLSFAGTGSTHIGTPLRAIAAPGTGARLRVRISSDVTIKKPNVTLELPSLAGLVWAGQYRLERRTAGDTVLALADDMLSGTPNRLMLIAGQPRSYELWIDVPSYVRPGLYLGGLTIAGEDRMLTIPVEIDVVGVMLPPAAKPSGFYADVAPHLTWFEGMSAERDRQVGCDLQFLARMGLTGTAPPLATPSHHPGDFEADMARADRAGLASPWFAYAPAKRLLERDGIEGSAAAIGRLQRQFAMAGLAAPVWSLADEPSNPDQPAQRLKDWIAAIRKHAPDAKIAAQLNSPRDHALIAKFDIVVLNGGYGLELAQLAAARSLGPEVWLYNTDRPRISAGLWLHISAASRYMQWHARMPTADPFDPIDGREGDVQALLPSREICPSTPPIDRSLLDMADGVVDQRWLAWLATATTAEAGALRSTLKARLPSVWSQAAAMSPYDQQRLRESIIEVARRAH